MSTPSNLEAERAVLGSVLIDSGSLAAIADFLRPEDFYRRDHADLFAIMLDLNERREPVDVVTVGQAAARKGVAAAVIADLANATPTSVHIEQYAHTVHDKAVLRRLIEVAGTIAAIGKEDGHDVKDAIDRATQALNEAVAEERAGSFVPIRQVLSDTYDDLEAMHGHHGDLTGVPTGIADLDRITGGLQPSDLIILAARPSVGKTSLALNIAEFVARHGSPVAFFSLEMSRKQLALRLLAGESRIDQSRLRTGIGDDEWSRVGEAMARLSMMPLHIDDTAQPSVLDLRTRARRMQATHGVSLVVVDYLGLVKSRRRDGNRVNEVSDISAGLKALARELSVPVLALSQLSRNSEHRDDHEPRLADLRDSGAIEQDADLVLFLWPEPAQEGLPPLVHLHVAKHRNGPTGYVDLTFKKEWTRFFGVEGRAA